MFSKVDLKQFDKKGISILEIERQIKNFQNGFPFINLMDAATPKSGIMVLSNDEVKKLSSTFTSKAPQYTISKMVPASGAASRMFKSLFTYLEGDADNANAEVSQFLQHIESFAFYPALKEALAKDEYDMDQLLADGEYKTIIRYLLEVVGLDYAALPKGLLDFHKYPHEVRTPLEEHMIEALEYATDKHNTTYLHFTVSPEHKEKFKKKCTTAILNIKQANNSSFDIGFSEQKSSTDTIAVDMENEPFRNTDGSLLFRPGGHGALIENLNDLDADIAFIKNIDNVVPDKLKDPTYTYKKVIGGLLIELFEKTNSYLKDLHEGEICETELQDAINFAKEELSIEFPADFESLSSKEKSKSLLGKLNRPIRICGMVKNEGEPGGGPFWVKDSYGNTSLQIVESSQIDLNNEGQKKIVSEATHFNPVDLVCSIKDFKGNKFDLKDFVDPQTGFISTKSKDGRDLKAQELPGLWNGAMAHWITLFVEVPIETFNPVKTVNDLLRPQHQ